MTTERSCTTRKNVIAAGMAILAAVASLDPSQAQNPFGTLRGASSPPAESKLVQAQLVADVAAINPGRSFLIAVNLQMTKGWHVYWKNAGGGMPTEIQLELPEGFTAEPFQFPVPKRFITPPDFLSYGYEGQAILVARVTPPGVIGTSEVDIVARASWLACSDKQCVLGDAELKLTLPVLTDPKATASPANVELFRQAAAAMPVPAGQAKGLELETYLSVDRVRPGDDFVAAVIVESQPGYTLERWGKPATAAALFFEKTDGLEFAEPAQTATKLTGPKGKAPPERITLLVPVKAAAELDGESLVIRGLVKHRLAAAGKSDAQAQGIEFEMRLPVAPAGATVRPMHPEVFGTVRPAAPATAIPAEEKAEPSGLGFLGRLGLPGLLLACALYGLALNATPCVLPIVSIKVVSFVQQAGERRGRAAALGISFGIGVLLLFVALGLLATAGRNLLQFPVAVIALGAVVMALALSMLGVYTLTAPRLAGTMDARIAGESIAGSFGKGLLAPVLGFACTGPLLAGAFAWATQQPRSIAVLAFLAAGIGMAAPYVLLSVFPGWLRVLPKPGPWMITFERVVGFLLLAAVVLLLHPLANQIGTAGLEWTLVFLVAVGAGCWLLGKGSLSAAGVARWGYRTGAAATVVVAALVIYGLIYPLGDAVARQAQIRAAGGAGSPESLMAWRAWSPEAVAEVVRQGKPAFVEFTADYCTSCKSNYKLFINTPEVRDKVEGLGVAMFRGDFSSYDEEIVSTLRQYGRAGVPLYLVFKGGQPDEQPEVLPVTISKQLILDALGRAADAGADHAS
jgi:thiol:disulfide interchange protein DsbD